MKKKYILPIILMASVFALSGCKDEEVLARKETRVDYEILDYYDYDKVKVVVEDEKTAQELAEDKLRDMVGLTDNTNKRYPEIGIADNQGVFVEKAIAEGPVIPNKSGFSEEDKLLVNDSGVETWEDTLQQSYDELASSQQKTLETINANVDVEADFIAEIQREADAQKLRIEEQRKAKEKQEQELEEQKVTESDEEDDYEW